MPPADERFSGHDSAGPQVNLGKVVQQQRFTVDLALKMEFDLVSEQSFQRKVVGHHDLVAAPALGRQDGFIGTTQ